MTQLLVKLLPVALALEMALALALVLPARLCLWSVCDTSDNSSLSGPMATAVIPSSVAPHKFRATTASRQTPLQTLLENSLSDSIALRLNISVKVLLSEVTSVTL
jgi:hypothetical protein